MRAEYDDLVLSLLRARGIEEKEEIEKFINPSYDVHLHDPLLMVDMPKAAGRLASAILSGERIAVWSDYDCDGIPGAVLMHDFLEKCGANFENYIPHRHDEGYGVNIPGIESLAASGVKLVVTVDSGITDIEAVDRANELGMEVIITDHHLPKETLPRAFAVLNPNARAEETYPYKSLAGSGVAWKLCCGVLAVSPELRAKVPEGWEKWLLDMAGLATIADMVPLTGENRLIAKYGLVVLRKSPRIGLQKLCRVMRTEQSKINEDDVGFMIAPRVNAASRLGDAREAFRLFTTTDEIEAEMLAKKLDKANRERRAQAGAITRAVHDRLALRTSVPSVIALGDPAWRPALLGLVANTIAEEYERPVFLWGREGNNSLKGSCRAGGGVHVLDLMGSAVETFVEFGGHARSGGFTVRDEAIFYLEDRLVEAHASLEETKKEEAAVAEADLHPEEASASLLVRLESLAPFGMGNEKPLFRFPQCEVVQVSRFGKGNEHLKVRIARDFGEPLEGVAFFAKGDLAKNLEALMPGSRADILAHVERDQFSRRSTPRLRLIGIVPL